MQLSKVLLIVVVTALCTACAQSPVRVPQYDGGVDGGVDGSTYGDAGVLYCGDRIVSGAETCDDGNLLNGDGCGPDCMVEPGWSCTGEPSVCVSLCGNGLLDLGEICEGANLDGQTCLTIGGGYSGGTLLCSPSCQFDATGCTLLTCGDNVVDTGEACDDGNSSNTDGCMNNCQSAECGDGYVWAGTEPCDDGNSSNTDGCLTGCTVATCGDGNVWAGNEACDDGNAIDTDGCLVGCVVASCGDGLIWAGVEECDDGNTADGDGCSALCTQEPFPVLHWATGQSAVWDSMMLTTVSEPHAPTTPVIAAANVDQRGRAYLFTATTYHALSLPGHQWLASGSITSKFPSLPANNLIFAWGVSWPSQPISNVVFAVDQPGTGMMAYTYLINNSTGDVVLNGGGPTVPDWSLHLDPPDPLDVKAAYVDLYNANGWVIGSPLAICGAGSTSIGPNIATFTDNNQIFLYDAGWCMQFYDHMHVSIFPPFTPGAPSASDIDATFYSSEHGDRLYIVEVP